MKNIVKKYDSSGKWEVVIPFEKMGEEKAWLGVIDARIAGEYELQVTADHKAAQTKGRITVRAVVGAGSHLKICGKIKIHKEAQKTDNFLELRVLMIDNTGTAIVDPELEIEANDVIAGHAASVGNIDEQQILYMMSRGLPRQKAIDQIVEAWVSV